ncbi:MAG: MATE family efflux transporter [Acidobacteriota bacterium]
MTEKTEIKSRSDMLAFERIGRLLFKLSVPAIIGMMVQGLYNLVDTIFVGRYTGTLGIGGITIAFPIQMILMGIGMTIGIGGASLISRRMGEKKHEEACLTLGNMVSLAVISGIICLVAGLTFLKPLLVLFGATEALIPIAKEYIVVILLGSPVITFSMVASSSARAEGNAKVAMNTMLIGALLNIALDPVFIIFLDMGVRGAAIATVLSIIASSIFLLRYYLGGKSEVSFHLKHLPIKLYIVREIFAVGISDFARTAAMSLTSALFNNILRSLGGELPIATFGVLFRVISFVFMPMIGIAQGAQPILGFNFGAKQFNRVKKSFRLANWSATAISIVGFLVFFIFPTPILRIFSNDPDLIAMGTNAMRMLVIGLPLVGYQNIGTSLFQAIGKAKPAVFLALSRQVLFLIPLVIILSRIYGLPGVWFSFPAADFVAYLVTLVMVHFEMKRLTQQHIQQKSAASN